MTEVEEIEDQIKKLQTSLSAARGRETIRYEDAMRSIVQFLQRRSWQAEIMESASVSYDLRDVSAEYTISFASDDEVSDKNIVVTLFEYGADYRSVVIFGHRAEVDFCWPPDLDTFIQALGMVRAAQT